MLIANGAIIAPLQLAFVAYTVYPMAFSGA